MAPPVAVEHVAFTPALPSDRAQIGGELSWREEAPAALQQLLDRATDVRCESQAVILLLRRRRASLLGSNVFDPIAFVFGTQPVESPAQPVPAGNAVSADALRAGRR